MSEQMSQKETDVLELLQKRYSEYNQFYNHAKINIEKSFAGYALQTMEANKKTHANIYGKLHGGAMMTMADSCSSAACASLGKKVVTLDCRINFFANVDLPAKVTCEANVVHNGKKTIIMAAQVYDKDRTVLARMQSTYFVLGVFEEIAEIMQRTE